MGAFSPSFLIISARLYQRSLISNPKCTFIRTPPSPPRRSLQQEGQAGISAHCWVSTGGGGRGRAWIIMVGQLSVVKGAGERGGEEDYGENGSIHQSISNEGKNWSESSCWKSSSAWGGSSSLLVSRVAGLWRFFGQQRPKREMTAITADGVHPNIYICGIFCILSHCPWLNIPLFQNISYKQIWKMTVLSFTPLFTQTAMTKILYFAHSFTSVHPNTSTTRTFVLTKKETRPKR